MRVLVTGATGYIGGRLVPRLLEAGHEVRVLVRDRQRIAERPWENRVELFEGDLLDPRSLRGLCEGIDAAYYLVHSMGSGADFHRRDVAAARNFRRVARGVGHVIYLGGLLPKTKKISQHLRSRARVGEILQSGLGTTEFRAGPIIGSGSASFEMVRYLTERLPVMVTPKWVLNDVQPIAVRDVLAYLEMALGKDPLGVVEIGADRLTFKGMMEGFASVRGYRRWIFPVPVLAPKLAALWVGAVTPVSNKLAVPLVEGVVHPVVANTETARRVFAEIDPIPYHRAVKLALEKTRLGAVETHWSGALGTAPTRELTDREGLIQEERTLLVQAPREAVFRSFTSLGGDRGWLVWDWAWQVRGAMDLLIGGPGLRRGRRHAFDLYAGEALDFWRVERVERPALLRLRAEMKVPGRAWLQFEAHEEGDATRLVQRAIFAPRGFLGPLYWYSLYPIHGAIFSSLIRAVGRQAVAMHRRPGSSSPK